MSRNRGSVRTTQLITTYGVGSLVALNDESYAVAGLDYWPERSEDEIHEPRLERLLGVNRFRRPPSSEDREDVPVVRFPTWHWCPSCDRLNEWKYFGSPFGGESRCTLCDDGPELIPSRFVVVCENGHLDDFPYFRWVHADMPHARSDDGPAQLSITSSGRTSGLRDIQINCSCGAHRSMEGAFASNAMMRLGPCTARRPWLDDDESACDGERRVVQRGASNTWFSVTQSAISIPPWSERAFRLLDRHWQLVRAIPPDALAGTIANLDIADGEYSIADLVAAARERIDTIDGEISTRSLKGEEYEALIRTRVERSREQEFVCVPATDPGVGLGDWFSIVQQVRRLRIVRALTGFTRLRPDDGRPERVMPLSESSTDWLPAIEVTGEGVFISLESRRLTTWEQRPDVRQRIAQLDRRDEDRFVSRGSTGERREITPRLVLVHTLAHALIDQWALESGYPAASLSERLYVDDSMAAVMIYTATSDSAGSLGGVISMTEDGRLLSSLSEALARASWCGQDPLCIESESQGVDGLNLAACHSCALLPETSCEESNSFLDRGLLVGAPNAPTIGYFSELLN